MLRLLEEHRVDYMIVGGYAVAYHGYPRLTNDIDLFFNSAGEKATQRPRDRGDVEELTRDEDAEDT